MTKPINSVRILLVDDHQIVIDGLIRLLEDKEQPFHIDCALSGREAIRKVEEENFDLVLLDINLPDVSGFEVCKATKSIKSGIKVIALTMHGESGYINRMIKSDVDGYILKNTGKAEMLEAVRTVMRGESYFSREVTDSVLKKCNPTSNRAPDIIQKLTRREKEILQLIVEEFTTDQIAGKLFISSTTVISHRKSLLRKLNAKNTAGLVRAAFEFNLLNDCPPS